MNKQSLRNAIGSFLRKISKKNNYLPIDGIVYPFEDQCKLSMRI